MPDILLIQPPIRDFYLTAKRTLPYGLACIAASARKAGFSVTIFDGLATSKSRIRPWPSQMDYLTPFFGRPDKSPLGLFHHFRHFGYSISHIAEQAKKSDALLIGISSLFTAYSDVALETAAAVKKVCPKTPVVLGGHHPTALPESVIRNPSVDYVLRGDGEIGLPALAQALRNKTPIDEVPGIVYLKPDGVIVKKPPAIVNKLDSLPVPALDLLDWRHYQRSGKGSLALTATRGCPMRCTYCAVNASTYHGFRQRSIDSVMTELKTAMDIHPMGFIDFEDEHLCVSKSWILALMKRITRQFAHQHIELRAMNGLYAPNLDRDILQSMQKAGFQTLNLALISTAPSVLKRFARPNITNDVDRAIGIAQQRNLNCVVYIIVAGPEQDPYQSIDDLLFLAGRRALSGVSIFYPAPGSADFQWCRRKDLLPSDPMLYRSTALPLDHITNHKQAVTLLRIGRVLNFMKQLLDSGLCLPLPSKPPQKIDPKTDRLSVGKQILSAFLNDGAIFGVNSDGGLYPHTIDLSLARKFIHKLKSVTLRGTTR